MSRRKGPLWAPGHAAGLLICCLFLWAMSSRQSAYGLACVPFQGSPATSGKCDPLVTYPNMLLQDGETVDTVDARAGSLTKLAGAFVPVECRQALLSFVCLANFLQCTVNQTTMQPTVVRPCRSVCENVTLQCASFAAQNNVPYLLPDCNQTVTLFNATYPAFPPDGSAPCNVPPPTLFIVEYSQADCPYPLKYNHDGVEYYSTHGFQGTDICLYPCPDPSYSDSEWNGLFAVTIVLNFFSFWLSLFLVVTFLLMPQRRMFPAVIFLYFALLSLLLSFACLFFPAVRGSFDDLVCTEGNPPVLVTMGNAGDHAGGGVPCILQGIVLYYCPMAAMFWWIFLILTVFELIVLERSTRFIRRFHLLYHLIAWGLPLVGLVIMLASENIGAISGSPVCFMNASDEEYTWILFFGPLSIALILGSFLMIISIIKFIRVRFRFKGNTREKLKQLIHMILLVVVYFFILAYPLIFRIYERAIQDDLVSAIEEQVACSAQTGTNCKLSERLNYGAYVVEIADLSCYGIVIFLTLCSSDIVAWWYNLIKAWATLSPGEAWDITKSMIARWDSKTAATTGSLTKSSTKQSQSSEDDFDSEDDTNNDGANNEGL